MSPRDEIRPTTYEEWNALEEERDQLRDELSILRSAPVAVEVPELTDAELDAIYPEPSGLGEHHREEHRKRLRIVISAVDRKLDSSRILKDGEFIVDQDFLDRVAKMVPLVQDEWKTYSNEFKLADSVSIDIDKIRALRYSKEGA